MEIKVAVHKPWRSVWNDRGISMHFSYMDDVTDDAYVVA